MQRAALLLWITLLAQGAGAAVIEGVVLDEETGYPLARAQVNMLPIAGTGAAAVSLRSGDRGSFTILSVRAGWYVLRVTRVGFAPAEAGQMRAGRPGTPFEVTNEDRSSFFQIRMRRLPAVTGAVLDENGIGIADWPVHIYTARRPVRRIMETKTDDRGNYRMGALDPGAYVIRSGAGTLEDDYSLLPTYFKYGIALENSEPVRLRLGETQTDVVIHPTRGHLLSVAGVFNSPPLLPARLTLITDTGRRQIASTGAPTYTAPFDASGIPPGPVELLAEGVDCGGYTRLIVDKDTQGIRIGCSPLQRSSIEWTTDGGRAPAYPVFLRRVDLDGVGPVKAWNPSEPILPGHWEVMAQTGASHYVTGVRNAYGAPGTHIDDSWFGLDISTSARLLFQLSARPAAVTGSVATAGKPVTGAVVYLESYNPDRQNERIQLWSARTDLQGNYSFTGLRPGKYRVISTFDFDPEDRYAMERAPTLTLREGDQAVQPVELILP